MATIAFAQDEYSQPMIDFAAALEHRGHRTVRLLADSVDDVFGNPSRVRWENLSARTVPEATLPSGPLTGLGWSVLAEEAPLDIQATESSATWLSLEHHDDQLGVRKVAAIPDRDVIDKLALTRFLDDRGIAVPRTWDQVDDVPPTSEVPLLFKLRDSGGGRGVHLCRDATELRRWVDEYGEDTPYLVQEFYRGVPVIAAGVAAAGEVIQGITYTNLIDPVKPFGFGYGLTVTDDPDLVAYTARVISTLGISGPFAMDAVRNAAGHPLLVDLNIRIWGSWLQCQAAGLDVLGSYEHALGLGPRPTEPRLVVGSFHSALRTPPLAVSSLPARTRWLAAELRIIADRAPWMGKPWTRLARRRALGWAGKGKPLPTVGD